MSQNEKKAQKKSRGWLWKIPLGLLVLLLIVLAVAVLSINTIAHNQINRAMNDFSHRRRQAWRRST
jgi:NADH:ubiquinone oxidoreductase subunit 6 (subunit J)